MESPGRMVLLCLPYVGSAHGHTYYTQLQHPRVRGSLKRGNYYSKRDRKHPLSSLKETEIVPCLPANMGKLSSVSAVSGSPWRCGEGHVKSCWAGSPRGSFLTGLPGAAAGGRASGRGRALPGACLARAGRAGANGGRGVGGEDCRFFGDKTAIYINYRRLGGKVKEVIVRIPNVLIYKLCNHHSWVAQLLTISLFFFFFFPRIEFMLKPRDVSLVNDILKLGTKQNCDIINF